MYLFILYNYKWVYFGVLKRRSLKQPRHYCNSCLRTFYRDQIINQENNQIIIDVETSLAALNFDVIFFFFTWLQTKFSSVGSHLNVSNGTYSAGEHQVTLTTIHCLSLIPNWPLFYSPCRLQDTPGALRGNPSAFSCQLSFIICFHYNLIFSITSHLSLHSSQLKIAIMDISNQVSFGLHSLVCHLFLNPSTCAFAAITTWSVSNLLCFTVRRSALRPVCHHPSLYFTCKAFRKLFLRGLCWLVRYGSAVDGATASLRERMN